MQSVTIGTFNKKTAQKNYSMKQLIDRKVDRNTEEEGIREGSQDEAKIKRKDEWDSDQQRWREMQSLSNVT